MSLEQTVKQRVQKYADRAMDKLEETKDNAMDKLEEIKARRKKEAREATASGIGGRLISILGRVYSSPLKAFRPVQQPMLATLQQGKKQTNASAGQSLKDAALESKFVEKHPKLGSRITAVPTTSASATSGSSNPVASAMHVVDSAKTIQSEHGNLQLAKHLMPPLLINMLLGTVLFTSYQQIVDAQLTYVAEHPDHPYTKYIGYNTKQGSNGWFTKHLWKPIATDVSSESNDDSIQKRTGDCKLYISGIASAGFVAGALQALVAAPLDLINHEVETIQEQQRSNSSKSAVTTAEADLFSVAQRYAKQYGATALWHNLPLTLLRDGIGIATFFSVFETSKALTTHYLDDADWLRYKYKPKKNSWTNASVVVVSGIAAGMSYRIVSQPFFQLQSLQLQHRTEIGNPKAHISYRELLKEAGGFKVLFEGFPRRLQSIFSPAVIGLFAFELTKDKQERGHIALAV